MKAILYVIAIAAIGAGGWFSYETKSKFETRKADREELHDQNEKRKAYIAETKKKAKDMEGQRDKAKSRLAEAEEGLKTAESNVKLAKKEAAAWNTKLNGQREKLEEIQNLIAEIKKTFAKEGMVDLDQVPAFVKKLEDDLKQANKKLEELQALTENAEGRVARNNQQIKDLNTRMAKRAARLKGNSAQGRITAVNHDWGFVTLQIPKDMPVSAESKLIVKRGNSYVGSLNINAIEGKRIIADIDYKEMKPGMVVQPGDSVVLAKPVTN